MRARVTWTQGSNGLDGAQAKARSAIAGVFRAQASAVLSDMQRRTPVDTGALRGSETVTADDTSMMLKATAPHGPYVHFGTRYVGPRPFMQDAMDAAVPKLVTELTSAIEGALT